MTRMTLGLAAPLLALSLVAGCGGADDDDRAGTGTGSPEPSASQPAPDPSEGQSEPGSGEPQQTADAPGAGSTYCELLSTDFASLFAGIQGPQDVRAAVGVIQRIADSAPPAVADEWDVMEGALGSMRKALIEAAELQKKAAAGKVTQEELQKKTAELMKDMEALNTPENERAGDAVARHASEYCGLQLG